MNKPPPQCVTCAAPRPGLYCAACGEKGIVPEDRTLAYLARHLLEAFTNANGKVFLTFETLLRHPGRLTADHVRGRRKPYVPPLQLFFLANVIFFLLHPLIGSNTLTTALNTHLHYTWHQGLAQALVQPRLEQRKQSVDDYARLFDAAAVTQAKSLVIFVVPIFSLAVAGIYWHRRKNYIDHLVFAAHFCTYWLLLTCVALAVTNLLIRLLRTIDVFPSATQVSTALFVGTLAIMAVYFFRATRVVFQRQSPWLAALKAVGLGVLFNLSLHAYRCILFFITFWST